MNHRQIELFLAVAERLNISDAADAMNITQPGLSKSMQRLQEELGTKLYHRKGRGIELTEAGHVLLQHARRIRLQLAEANAEVAGIASGAVGHARIGAGPSWLSRHLPDSIAAISARHPRLRFTVKGGFPDQLVRQLRRGELDVVVGALPDNRNDPDLRFSRLTADTIRVVGRSDHPLLGRPNRTLSDYAVLPWILPGRHELARQRLAQAFRSAGFAEPVAAVEADSLSLILATLRLTDFLGLTTTQILLQDEARGIVPIDHDQLRFSREAGITIRRYSEQSPSVKLLVTELRRIAATRVEN